MRSSFPAKLCLALICAALLSGCGSSGSSGRADLASAASGELAPPKIERGDSAQRAEYRLAPDDVIDISVYQVPDLNRSVQIDGSGRIMLPLVGVIHASGKTIRELELDLTKRLGAKYLQSPQVAIFLKESIGQRVIVEGDVRTPGVVQSRGGMTLLAAIASAGGFGETADFGAVFVLRQTEKGRMAARFDVAQIRAGAAQDPQIYGGDTIIVDSSTGKTAWKGLRDALPVATFFKFMI